jgi:hypothetical protein
MKFEDIILEWEKDSKIDKTELADEAIKIPSLHHKYYKFFINERLVLRRYEADMKKLKMEKYEFYTQGPTKEQVDLGWKLPAKGLILKGDIPMYMETDDQMIDMSLKIGTQQEKVDFLESIIKSFQQRSYTIKTAVDFIKWTNGG